MRTFYDYKTYRESLKSQHEGGRHNPAKVLKLKSKKYGDIRIVLSVGDNDEYWAFVEGDMLYVLAVNYRMEYIGVNVYDLSKSGEEAGDVFWQDSETIEENIGKNWQDLTAMTLVKRMTEYLP